MATAKDMIKRARRLVGSLGNGEEPEPQELSDDLAALNTMLESWGLAGLTVHQLTDVALTWTSGQASMTIGATGDFAQTRPSFIKDAFQRLDSIDYPIDVLEYDVWYAIPDKTTTTNLVEYLWYEGSYPNATIHLYPVPNAAISLHIASLQALQSFSVATTTVSLPPGYQRAIEYSLAVELAPEYGRTVTKEVRATQMGALRNLKAANRRVPSAVVEVAGLTRSGSDYNIYADRRA